MGGETPELALEPRLPQDASTKKLSDCLKRIGDELDSNIELQRCGPRDPGVQPLVHWSPYSSLCRSLSSQPHLPLKHGVGAHSPHFLQGSRASPLNSALSTPSLLLPQDLETLLQGVIFSTFLNVHLVPFPHIGLLPFISVWLGPQFPYLCYGVDTRVSTPYLILPPQHWLSSFPAG